tara:strand:+ start:1887 stop:2129 length:243 start_codon:yes stop_codon:yes gene_type:complete
LTDGERRVVKVPVISKALVGQVNGSRQFGDTSDRLVIKQLAQFWLRRQGVLPEQPAVLNDGLEGVMPGAIGHLKFILRPF